jgi:hypothetical protein
MTFLATHEILRDPRHSSNTSATLAVADLNLRNKSDREYLEAAVLWSRVAAARAWKHFDRLGAIHYPLTRAARIAGAATLYAAGVDDTNNVTGPLDRSDPNGARAIDVVSGIYSRTGGLRGLIERYFLQQKVPADSHLIRVKEGSSYDGYMFISPDELRTPADGDPGSVNEYRWITRPAVQGIAGLDRRIARSDYLGRVYSPSPRFIDTPDSPLFVLDGDCDLLHRMNVMLRALYRSRVSLNGLLFLPQSLQQLAVGEIVETGSTQLTKRLAEIEKQNMEISEDGDAVDTGHIILSGPDDAGAKILEIILGSEAKETDLKLRQEITDRILFALDINTRATTGDSQNHFQAWSDNADEVRLAVKPDLEAMCWSLTRLILRPELLAADIPAEQVNRIVVWYDLSAASVRINRQEDSRQLADRGGLALRAARRESGFEETDAPSEVEQINQFGFKHGNAYMATWKNTETSDPDWDWDKALPKAAGRPASKDGDPAESEPGQGDPGSPSDPDAKKPPKA